MRKRRRARRRLPFLAHLSTAARVQPRCNGDASGVTVTNGGSQDARLGAINHGRYPRRKTKMESRCFRAYRARQERSSIRGISGERGAIRPLEFGYYSRGTLLLFMIVQVRHSWTREEFANRGAHVQIRFCFVKGRTEATADRRSHARS